MTAAGSDRPPKRGRILSRPCCYVGCLALLVLSLSPWQFNAPIRAEEETAAPIEDIAAIDARIVEDDREHWAYRPIVQPFVPTVRNAEWCRTPIDAFILSRLEQRDWQPAQPATRAALMRRLYFDLTGLPPTLDEQDAFLNDAQPDAWERLIDDLLSRPAYGERWGRYWLDLVRYAETNGYERDAEKPHVWRYRDYVIDSLNADKPYDRFVLEQLAGDELDDRSTETVIATGFYRLGPWDDEPADFAQDRFDQLDDMIRTTSEAFLATTLGCARCHHHKFDPLTAVDYYRMAAVFNTLERPRDGRTEQDRPAGSRAQLVESAAQLPRGYFMEELSATTLAMHLLHRGRASAPGPEVGPGVPVVLTRSQPEFLPPDAHSSRRRLTFARWIASADNPLTARVIVNRVWQNHFGFGLARAANDFGLMGEEPTHPELLDWLAHWFMHEGGWSLKRLHRLILSSSTYQMSKAWNEAYGGRDPESRFYWRFPYRRLEVEALRDATLAASGMLDRRMAGPGIYLSVPKAALAGNSDPDKIWPPFDERASSRRTVYAFVKRSLVVPYLEVLDLCDTTRSSEQRKVTSIAPQALTLFNGEFVNQQAEHFARRLEHESSRDSRAQITLAFRIAVARLPTETELNAFEQFLEQEGQQLKSGPAKEAAAASPQHRALVQLCRVIFNLNEFAYID